MVDIAVKSFVQTVEDRGNEAIFHGYCSGPPFTEKTPCIQHDMRMDLGFIDKIAPDLPEPV
jgi:hypothetical protein